MYYNFICGNKGMRMTKIAIKRLEKVRGWKDGTAVRNTSLLQMTWAQLFPSGSQPSVT